MGNIEFYVIYNWMRDELELAGTELDCYAVIYSLSQSDNRYIAGVKRLMELLHKTEPTIIAALKALTKKGLVTKEPVMVNNIKRYYYKGKRPSKDNQEPKENKEEKGEKDTTLNNLSNPLKSGEETTLNDLSSINNINNKENNNKKRLSNDNPKEDYPDDFMEFYNAYGYARSKYKAYLSWKKLSKKDKKAAIDAIPVYKKDCKINDREMKYPSTYLNQRTWEDDFDISSNKEEPTEEETLYPEGMDAEQWNEITMWMCNNVPLIAGKIDPISFGQMKDMAGDSKLFSELLKQVNEDFSLDSSHSVKSVFYKRLKEYRNGQKG